MVHFQEDDAWCDGPAMEYCTKNCYMMDNEAHWICTRPKNQITSYVFKKCACNINFITPVFVQSIIQSLDMCYNALYLKRKLKMQNHLEEYFHGKFNAGERYTV